MTPHAIKKAAKRIQEARYHLAELRSLETSPLAEALEEEWYRFLVTVHSVPEALKTGSRGNARSRQWIDGQYKVLRSDPLLQYLFQSRAADFHGTHPLLKLHMTQGHYEVADIDPMSDSHETARGVFHVPPEVTRLTLWYELLPAVDEKHGDTFQPPAEHLGKRLEARTPSCLAELAIAFYAGLVKEAATRPWSGIPDKSVFA